MGANCCAPPSASKADPAWRRALWVALAVNATMFTIEIGASLSGHSLALRADAIDFLGDSANYAISLAVAGLSLIWRARTAVLKGVTMGAFGIWLLLSAGWAVLHGGHPHAETMGIVGALALLANVFVAVMLFRHRGGDANMRSVWLCSRNDAIGNLAVLAAAGGVFGLRQGWPDVVVAAIMAALALWSATEVARQAFGEIGERHQHA